MKKLRNASKRSGIMLPEETAYRFQCIRLVLLVGLFSSSNLRSKSKQESDKIKARESDKIHARARDKIQAR